MGPPKPPRGVGGGGAGTVRGEKGTPGDQSRCRTDERGGVWQASQPLRRGEIAPKRSPRRLERHRLGQVDGVNGGIGAWRSALAISPRASRWARPIRARSGLATACSQVSPARRRERSVSGCSPTTRARSARLAGSNFNSAVAAVISALDAHQQFPGPKPRLRSRRASRRHGGRRPIEATNPSNVSQAESTGSPRRRIDCQER